MLVAAWRKGARFDGWTETFSFSRWMDAFNEEGLDPGQFAARERKLAEGLPWDHIHCGVTKEFLAEERALALAGSLSADCRPVGGREGAPCRACGVQDRCIFAGKGRSS